MLRNFSQIISYLFHPVFLPLYGIIIILHSGIYSTFLPWQVEKVIYLVVVLFCILLPLMIIMGMNFFKLVRNIELETRRERILPLFLTVISFYLSHRLLLRLARIEVLSIFTFSCVLVVLFILLISVFRKISLHMAGIGGLVGLIISLSFFYGVSFFYLLIATIIASGLIGFARLYLNAHRIYQVGYGYLIGLLTVLGVYFSFFLGLFSY